jgi:hypothetical protein
MNPKLLPFLLSGALLLSFSPPAVAQLPTQAASDNFGSPRIPVEDTRCGLK